MTTTATPYVPVDTNLGCAPPAKIGRKVIHVEIDFTLGQSYDLNLGQVQQSGNFDSLQTIYVDNSENSAVLTITCGATNQEIEVPANAQGYFPVLSPNPPDLQVSPASGTPTVHLYLMNFFVPPGVWYPGGLTVIDSTLAAVISGGAVNVNNNPVTLTGVIDASGTITAGTTPQALFAADAARKRWILCNPLSASEKLQFAYGAASTDWIDLAPGAVWDESDNAVSGDAIRIVAATTGHAFTAYRWG